MSPSHARGRFVLFAASVIAAAVAPARRPRGRKPDRLRSRLAFTPLEAREMPAVLPTFVTAVGASPAVRVAGGTGAERFSFTALDPAAATGVRVAAADFIGDDHPEVAAVPGPGGPPVVGFFHGKTGERISSLQAFPSTPGLTHLN